MSRLKLIIRDNKSGEEGAIVYRPSSQEVSVTHPDREVRDLVRGYLRTPRTMVEGDGHLNRQTRIVTPTESLITMYNSLVEMTHELGVSPVWSSEDNQLPDVHNPAETGEFSLEPNKEDDMHKGLYINL